MAKSLLKLQARTLRSQGESVKDIAKKLGIAKSTVSLWVRDIILSVEQLQKIRKNWITKTEAGRLKGAFMQKQRRIDMQNKYYKLALQNTAPLSSRELLFSGLCLYWGEGSKKKRELSWCNSDPELINFMILWLNKCFKVSRNRLTATLGINEMHKEREEIVKKYWSDKTSIPLSKFKKTSFKHAKLNKVYENFDDHYGTLRIRVLKPGRLYYKIMSQILALGKISQGSSVG